MGIEAGVFVLTRGYRGGMHPGMRLRKGELWVVGRFGEHLRLDFVLETMTVLFAFTVLIPFLHSYLWLGVLAVMHLALIVWLLYVNKKAVIK